MIQTQIYNYKIVIADNVQAICNRHIQYKKTLNESGGILLGQVKDNVIYILKASIPNEFDKSSRFSFVRNKSVAQLITNYEFENSEGKTVYLGEWHTHPEKRPSPSNQDIKMIEGQFRLGILNENFILLMIQGIEMLYICMYIDGNRHSVSLKNGYALPKKD